MPEDGAANTVTDDEAEVDVCDGLHKQPLSTTCEAVSEDQGTLMVEQLIIQEYVLLFCRYDGMTMIDHQRFAFLSLTAVSTNLWLVFMKGMSV